MMKLNKIWLVLLSTICIWSSKVFAYSDSMYLVDIQYNWTEIDKTTMELEGTVLLNLFFGSTANLDLDKCNIRFDYFGFHPCSAVAIDDHQIAVTFKADFKTQEVINNKVKFYGVSVGKHLSTMVNFYNGINILYSETAIEPFTEIKNVDVFISSEDNLLRMIGEVNTPYPLLMYRAVISMPKTDGSTDYVDRLHDMGGVSHSYTSWAFNLVARSKIDIDNSIYSFEMALAKHSSSTDFKDLKIKIVSLEVWDIYLRHVTIPVDKEIELTYTKAMSYRPNW